MGVALRLAPDGFGMAEAGLHRREHAAVAA